MPVAYCVKNQFTIDQRLLHKSWNLESIRGKHREIISMTWNRQPLPAQEMIEFVVTSAQKRRPKSRA